MSSFDDPETLPTDSDIAIMITARLLRLRSVDGQDFNLIANSPSSFVIRMHFKPAKVGASYDTVRLEWQEGDYSLNTDVFIQNMAAHLGITANYDISGEDPPPGVFIEFK